MKRTRFQVSLVLLLATIFGTGAADRASHGEAPPGEHPLTAQLPSPVTRWQQWHGFSGSELLELRTLLLNSWLPDRELTQVLAEGSGPSRLILSEERFILDGVSRFRIVEAQTGWWLELTEYSGLKLDSVSEAADPAQIALKFSRLVDQDFEGRLAFRAQAVRLFEVPLRLWQDDAYLQFADRFADRERGAVLVKNMTESSREAIRQMASLTKSGNSQVNLGRFENLLVSLTAILDREEIRQENPLLQVDWSLVDEGYRNNLELASEQAAFANLFEGISGDDPQADLRTAQPPEH
ncbi:MAG: hypothetical protein K0U98_22290 [Deltaproteobacteria bacterium]|nr:hypothetical protein [Deltaproteobacteria bacterium]